MADEIDRAAEYEQRARESAMLTSRKPVGPVACGSCHYCGESLGWGEARWCDVDCKTDYEREQRLRGRQ